MPEKTRRPHKVARAQCRAIQTVALRGAARSGRKMTAMTSVRTRNHAMNRAERNWVMPAPC